MISKAKKKIDFYINIEAEAICKRFKKEASVPTEMNPKDKKIALGTKINLSSMIKPLCQRIAEATEDLIQAVTKNSWYGVENLKKSSFLMLISDRDIQLSEDVKIKDNKGSIRNKGLYYLGLYLKNYECKTDSKEAKAVKKIEDLLVNKLETEEENKLRS